MADYAPLRFKSTTVLQLESLLRVHMIPVLGDLRLGEIGTRELQGYLAGRSKAGLSPRTLRNHVVALRQLFSVAAVWGLVDVDPSVGLQSPRQPRRDIPFLKPDELHRLVEATPTDYRLITALPAYCGLRRGEVLSLRFDHWDPDKRTLLIEHSKRGDTIHEPKSRASIATIPYPASLTPMFEHGRSLVADKAGLMLCKKDGSALADSFANRVLKAALEQADLPPVTYHQLRGSWVYAHMRAGTPIQVIKNLGRWENVETLLRSYGRWLPTAGGDAVDALDREIGSTVGD
jgi:integrase